MMSRILVLFLAFLALATEAFVPTFAPRSAGIIPLFACRTNAKKEKIRRNRENMRKFMTGGRRGLSRRKMLKKAQSSRARQDEAEFITKCFITTPASPSAGEASK